MAKRWYVIHAFSGFEGHVQRSLHERIKRAGMEDAFGDILVPTEEVVEIRNGQQRKSERKFFPGYVLVQMEMDSDTWHMVKQVPKVLGFSGPSATTEYFPTSSRERSSARPCRRTAGPTSSSG